MTERLWSKLTGIQTFPLSVAKLSSTSQPFTKLLTTFLWLVSVLHSLVSHILPQSLSFLGDQILSSVAENGLGTRLLLAAEQANFTFGGRETLQTRDWKYFPWLTCVILHLFPIIQTVNIWQVLLQCPAAGTDRLGQQPERAGAPQVAWETGGLYWERAVSQWGLSCVGRERYAGSFWTWSWW